MNTKPSKAQILAAAIRLERQVYEEKHRTPCGGGWLVPSTKEVYNHLSEVFGLSTYELSFYFTYSRTCTHSWKTACHLCPVPVIAVQEV
jgi:hypothetical protein